MWVFEYTAVCRGQSTRPEDQIPGALFTEADKARRVAEMLGGTVVSHRLVLDAWNDQRHEVHTVQVRIRPDGRPVTDPEQWTSTVRYVEGEVDQGYASSYLTVRNKWSPVELLTVEAASLEACRRVGIFRLETEPYVPLPKPGHWMPGDDTPPDLSRTHWIQPNGTIVTAAARPDAPPAPSAAAAPSAAPPAPSDRAQLVEHAIRNGLDPIVCPTCQTVCVLGAHREPREYRARNLARDDFALGGTHDAAACEEVIRRRPNTTAA